MTCLPEAFYHDDVLRVARRLLGMRLVRVIDGQRTGGRILETEAYRGEEDQACHARVGKTPRNAMLYSGGGIAYVYFTYGMHWLANAVTGEEGYPAAVLIRAILPMEGREGMGMRRKNRPEREWCNGPGKLCQALAVDGTLNGVKFFDPKGVFRIEEDTAVPEDLVKTSPRIGLGSTPEPWLSKPWRFYVNAEELAL